MKTEPPAKNMAETRNKVTELEQRLKHAEDMAESGRARIPEWHTRQILQHILDPETKKFETTPYAENDIKTMQTMLAKLNQNELNVEENVRSSNNSSESWAFKS